LVTYAKWYLLIKDIPFVTNISKCYDKDILNTTYDNQRLHNNRIDDSNYKKNDLTKDEFDFADVDNGHITDTIDSSDRVKNHEEELTKALRAQLNYNADIPMSKEHLETIKRLE
jgi:hypothetical protein